MPLACSTRSLALTDGLPWLQAQFKWFNGTKGYGFIQPDSGGKDVVVHISAVERSGLNGLHEGQKITYEIQQDRGKEAAVNLKA
jgi:CspA family cold shock protein